MKEGKLIENGIHGYYLTVNDKIYGVINNSDSKLQKISLKNCEVVKNSYDLDELAEEEAKKRHDWNKHRDTDIYNDLVREDAELIKIGFQKALGILGDKKFSEEDMIIAYHKGFFSEKLTTNEWVEEANSHIQLQQTEWDCTFNPDEKDSEGCLILKRKI